MWALINRLSTSTFDLLIWSFQKLSPTTQVCVVAFPVAVFALLVFRFVSNQAGIEAAKDKLKAHLLELRLFRDDLTVTLRAQGQVFRYSLVYMRHAFLPMVVMFVPIVLVIVQIESRYALRSLEPGESAILKVKTDRGEPVSALEVTLSLPPELVRETPALRIDETGEILWRIRGLVPGQYNVSIQIGETKFEKRVVVGFSGVPLSSVVYPRTDLRVLTSPVEPALEAGTDVSAIEISYPRTRAEFAGLSSATWLFFIASLILGYALRGLFGVTF